MGEILKAGTDIEIELQNAPDAVAEEFDKWKMAELKTEELEAILLLKFQNDYPEAKSAEIKARIVSDPERHKARLNEIVAQKGHERVSKRFMSLMKRADLRGRAF